MKRVPEAKYFFRLWSVQLAIASAALGAAEASLPLWSETIPPGAFAALASALGIASAVARAIRQEGLPRE